MLLVLMMARTRWPATLLLRLVALAPGWCRAAGLLLLLLLWLSSILLVLLPRLLLPVEGLDVGSHGVSAGRRLLRLLLPVERVDVNSHRFRHSDHGGGSGCCFSGTTRPAGQMLCHD